MKKFLFIILGVILVSCVPIDQNDPSQRSCDTYKITYYSPGDPFGTLLTIDRFSFEVDEHTMWVFRINNESKSVVHSPDCNKCNAKRTSEPKSVLEEPTVTTSDYWGW